MTSLDQAGSAIAQMESLLKELRTVALDCVAPESCGDGSWLRNVRRGFESRHLNLLVRYDRLTGGARKS